MHFSSRIFLAKFQNLELKLYTQWEIITCLLKNDKLGSNLLFLKQNLANSIILPPKNGGLKAWSHGVRKANSDEADAIWNVVFEVLTNLNLLVTPSIIISNLTYRISIMLNAAVTNLSRTSAPTCKINQNTWIKRVCDTVFQSCGTARLQKILLRSNIKGARAP